MEVVGLSDSVGVLTDVFSTGVVVHVMGLMRGESICSFSSASETSCSGVCSGFLIWFLKGIEIIKVS